MDTFLTNPSLAPKPDLDLGFDIVGDDDRLFLELSKLRDSLVEKAEEISMQLEANMNPSVAPRLSGDEQKKAVHLFKSQAERIRRDLFKLGKLAESFRVHIY